MLLQSIWISSWIDHLLTDGPDRSAARRPIGEKLDAAYSHAECAAVWVEFKLFRAPGG